MSISGVSGSPSSGYDISNIREQRQQALQQLGQDLQSGDLSSAQADFATFSQAGPFGSATSATASSSIGAASTAAAPGASPVGQAVNQLSQDLQAGNVAAAQQDVSSLQQALQTQQGSGKHHRHHHHGGGGASGQSSASSGVSQLFGQLGQSLQAGNLPAAQAAYLSLSQDFGSFGATTTPSTDPITTTPSTVSAVA
jgi:hypothetical protein